MPNVAISNLSSTWNNAGTTFTAIKMNVTDSASAAGSLLLDLQVGEAGRFSVNKAGNIQGNTSGFTITGGSSNSIAIGASGIGIGAAIDPGVNRISLGYQNVALTNSGSAVLRFTSSGSIGWATSTDAYGTVDLSLFRDAADTLAQRRTTNAQTFRLYNTFTDASNYERAEYFWNSSVAGVALTNAGSGSARSSFRFVGGTSGDFQVAAGTDNNAAVNFRHSSSTSAAGTSVAYVGRISGHRGLFDGSGAVTFAIPSGATDRWAFFGTTSSFPALKRNGAMLETRLADDSGFAAHGVEWISVTDGVTAPAAATGRARIYVDSADGDLKIVFADGTVKTIVTDS